MSGDKSRITWSGFGIEIPNMIRRKIPSAIDAPLFPSLPKLPRPWPSPWGTCEALASYEADVVICHAIQWPHEPYMYEPCAGVEAERCTYLSHSHVTVFISQYGRNVWPVPRQFV